MEATKKTTATRAALLVVAALSMLLSGLFIATAERSDASPTPECPEGFTLTADEKNCFQAAVITSADNPNTCAEGLITPDGTKCYIAARLIPQEGTTECPKGYSSDDSLGGMCARFEPADQHDEACPDGALGDPGGCYIRVAKGPRGDTVCTDSSVTISGGTCLKEVGTPTRAAGTCPSGDNIVQPGCYRLVSPDASTPCAAGYETITALGSCKAANPHKPLTSSSTEAAVNAAVAWDCPDAGSNTLSRATVTTADGRMKTDSCSYPIPADGGACPSGSTAVGNECRVAVPLIPGALSCPAGQALLNNKCFIDVGTTTPAAQCPTGSYEAADGECRKPVANVDGAYYCKDADAALNGKSCVFTAPFTVNKAENAYKCDQGTRAVIGEQVLCFLGDAEANTTEGPSCLQGVLSTDNKYCIVPRIDTAPAAAVQAPTPVFAG